MQGKRGLRGGAYGPRRIRLTACLSVFSSDKKVATDGAALLNCRGRRDVPWGRPQYYPPTDGRLRRARARRRAPHGRGTPSEVAEFRAGIGAEDRSPHSSRTRQPSPDRADFRIDSALSGAPARAHVAHAALAPPAADNLAMGQIIIVDGGAADASATDPPSGAPRGHRVPGTVSGSAFPVRRHPELDPAVGGTSQSTPAGASMAR
jgi:hypothetical protein